MRTAFFEEDAAGVGCEEFFVLGVDYPAAGRAKFESATADLAGETRKMLGSSTGSSGYSRFVVGMGWVDARDNSGQDGEPIRV